MQKLARALLEQWLWVVENEDSLKEAFHDDFLIDFFVEVQETMDSATPQEREAVRAAAKIILDKLLTVDTRPDEWGFKARSELTPTLRQYLEDFINFPEPGQDVEPQ